MTSSDSTATPEAMPNPSEKPKQTPLPDVGDIVFGAMVFLTLYLKPNFVFGDGSTAWHILTGQIILATGSVPKVDFLSTLGAGKEWVAYEWFADLVMAIMVKLGGLNLLAVGVCCAIACLFLLLYERMRKVGCHFGTALAITIIGAFTSAIHWLARPHIFTFYGVYIFSTRLEDYYKGKISGLRFYLPLVLFMLVWVNSHPAFLIGFALIGLYWSCALVSAFVYADARRVEYLSKLKDLTIAGLACLAVTFVNPNGINLYHYLINYFKGNAVIQATEEYMPPNFHGAFSPLCLLVLFALFVIGTAISRRKLTFPKLMACLAFATLALLSVRHMPLYVIMVLPALGELFSQVRSLSFVSNPSADVNAGEPEGRVERSLTASWWNGFVTKMKEVGDGFNENEAICQMHLLPIVVAIALTVASIFAPNTVVTSQFDPEDKPGSSLDALFKLVKQDPKFGPEHGINFDNWGGYIYYESLYRNKNKSDMGKIDPLGGEKVWIDDRADFHGEKHYDEYAKVSQVVTGADGYEAVMNKYHTNWILFPINSKIVAELKQHKDDWEVVNEDKVGTLMKRKAPI